MSDRLISMDTTKDAGTQFPALVQDELEVLIPEQLGRTDIGDALITADSTGLSNGVPLPTLIGAVTDYDPRLSDTRIPVDGSVTTAKLDSVVSAAIRPRGSVDLRDWDAIRNGQWDTLLGVTITAGSNQLYPATGHPFTTADIGKVVLINEDGSGGKYLRFMSTITDVDSAGVATLADTATSNSTGNRIRWGFDCTEAINDALAELAASRNGTVKEAYLPGNYWVSQIVIPTGITLRGAGFGSYSSRSNVYMGTSIMQLPGSECDLIVFSGGFYSAGWWFGPFGLSDVTLEGPYPNVRGTTWTTGSGLAFRDVNGNAMVAQDGVEVRRVQSRGFPEHGINIAGGGVPLTLDFCRVHGNGGYGIDYVYSNSQMVHVMNSSADHNVLGGMRFYGLPDQTSIAITSFKSEAAPTTSYDTSNELDLVPGYSAPSTFVQEAAIIFDECDDTPVVINGVDHLMATTEDRGPGPAILIKSATGKCPRLRYNAASVRISTAQSSGDVSDAVVLREEYTSTDWGRSEAHGTYPQPNDGTANL